MNILLRNTIMKEDDLCERLRFDRKLLRQLLHTLKTDQFIKSKMQIETEAEGKTNRITHYFIDFKVFVNVVKYRLDMMHRRLEGEQRDSSSRANYSCSSCNTTYTDLEIDRLVNPFTDTLICTYCKHEVSEQEDSIQKAGACAQVISKFNQQIRRPIDNLLQECEKIHLSSAILEPEIRPLEPMPGSDEAKNDELVTNSVGFDEEKDKRWAAAQAKETEAKSMIRVVVDGNDSGNKKVLKERPIWLRESTVHQTAEGENMKTDSSLVQTLTPGRIPQQFTNGTAGHSSYGNSSKPAAMQIMELLMIHEKRRPLAAPQVRAVNRSKQQERVSDIKTNGHSHEPPLEYACCMNDGRMLDYRHINLKMLKDFTDTELAEYRRVGKFLYSKRVYE
ncbi:General transcription factor IIE subunit 1 [Cichlidogyrus casuarinus]|uniref:General transcription factor IIE subunit 1 n=1 Tax=Cichlidogyrus casuarinus TaxID=1844966 RepID=A0ABD2QBR1_9PLAT